MYIRLSKCVVRGRDNTICIYVYLSVFVRGRPNTICIYVYLSVCVRRRANTICIYVYLRIKTTIILFKLEPLFYLATI